MKVPPLRAVGVTSFNVSRWMVLISSPVRSLQASIVPLFEGEAFALGAGAAFIFVTTGDDEFAAGAGGNVCVRDDCSLQPATNVASRTASVYNSRRRLIGIKPFSPEAHKYSCKRAGLKPHADSTRRVVVHTRGTIDRQRRADL